MQCILAIYAIREYPAQRLHQVNGAGFHYANAEEAATPACAKRGVLLSSLIDVMHCSHPTRTVIGDFACALKALANAWHF